MLNDKGVMTKTITVEQRLLTGIFPTMLSIHYVFTRHQLEWTTTILGRYIEVMMRVFYTAYMVTLSASFDKQVNPTKHAPLDHVSVRGKRVDTSCPPFADF